MWRKYHGGWGRGFDSRLLGLGRVPWIVGADAPEMAFEVAAGEGAAAVVHVADVEDHRSSGSLGGGVDGVGVGDDEVDALGLAEADLVGLTMSLPDSLPLSTDPSMTMPLPKVSWACMTVVLSGPR